MDDAGRLGRSGGNRGAGALDDARLGGPTDEAGGLLRTGDREANNRIDRTAAADALKSLIINDLSGATGLEPDPAHFSNLTDGARLSSQVPENLLPCPCFRFPWSPLQSPGVLRSRGDILETTLLAVTTDFAESSS